MELVLFKCTYYMSKNLFIMKYQNSNKFNFRIPLISYAFVIFHHSQTIFLLNYSPCIITGFSALKVDLYFQSTVLDVNMIFFVSISNYCTCISTPDKTEPRLNMSTCEYV